MSLVSDALSAVIDLVKKAIAQETADLEKRLAIAQGEREDALTDLAGVLSTLRLGRELFAELYKRHFVDADDYDKQLADMKAWAMIEDEK